MVGTLGRHRRQRRNLLGVVVMNNRRKETHKAIAIALLIWTLVWGVGLSVFAMVMDLLGGPA
jgi:hypothetical protein